MSRTTRRKGPLPWWVLRNEPNKARAKALYYSDKGIGRKWPVPRWYTRFIEHNRRRRDRAELFRLMRYKEYDAELFDIRHNNAGYYW